MRLYSFCVRSYSYWYRGPVVQSFPSQLAYVFHPFFRLVLTIVPLVEVV